MFVNSIHTVLPNICHVSITFLMNVIPTLVTLLNKMHARRCAYFFYVLAKRICMHKTKFLKNIFKYCFKN